MTRTQRTITIMLLALLIGLAISATVYAAPQRPPRRTDTEQRTSNRDTGCVLSRYPSPNNCRPELRPTPRTDQQRGR